ncbi:ATP-binding cassette domain-containing protein [Paenibacillus sp. y28]|uniref:ATP-binding cassette domain-containing protein n=1 Tax=Paenibacillus sp. y28 TaxID=3129110 RepID=UPI0030170AA7
MSLDLQQLTVYSEDRSQVLLSRASCRIEARQLTLLLGASGAGKSSLLNALGGLNPAIEGRIEYDGIPLWEGRRPSPTVLHRIGMVFQFPEQQLFARTVEGEFTYSLRPLKLSRDEMRQRTEQAMQEAGLPLTLLDASPFDLSGGQKRRVALASTLAARPEWLLLDEPTAGLDPASASSFIRRLEAMKARLSGGIVVATHDLEMLLPVADAVILVANGEILARHTVQALFEQPELLTKAGLALPAGMKLAEALRQQGILLPPGPHSAARMAALLHELAPYGKQAAGKEPAFGGGPIQKASFAGQPGARNAGEAAAGNGLSGAPGPLLPDHDGRERSAVAEGPDAKASGTAPTTGTAHAKTADFTPNHPGQSQSRWAARLDPRAKWIYIVLVSCGTLLQTAWPGLALAALATAFSVRVAGLTRRAWYPVTRPLLFFTLISFVFSGMHWGHEGTGWGAFVPAFSFSAAWATLFNLSQIWLVMMLGLILPATTSPFRMQKGIEQLLGIFRRLRIPVDALALAASLLIRFIPMLGREAQRFARIARSRGKRMTKSGGLSWRELPAMILPLLISVLQLASDLSQALESRGYTLTGKPRTSSLRLQLQRRDVQVMLTGLLLLLALLSLRLLLE